MEWVVACTTASIVTIGTTDRKVDSSHHRPERKILESLTGTVVSREPRSFIRTHRS